jgi:L-ascorbate peroxidase
MASSLAAASAVGTFRHNVAPSKPRTHRGAGAVAVRAQQPARSGDVEGSAAAVSRRLALSAGVALVGGLASASPALAGFLDNLPSLPTPAPVDVKEKRKINLPPLKVEPVSREEGYPAVNGGEKSRAQLQYIKFIEPIIKENLELPFGEYMRLALHDAGTFSVVGKKNGANGSIRFELDRPENKDVKEAFASIAKIKAAVDAKVTQPITWADIIAITPHFAARKSFTEEYFAVMGADDPNFEILFVGTNPYLGARVGTAIGRPMMRRPVLPVPRRNVRTCSQTVPSPPPRDPHL